MGETGDLIFDDNALAFYRDTADGEPAVGARFDDRVDRQAIILRRSTLLRHVVSGIALSDGMQATDGDYALRWAAPGHSLSDLISPERGADRHRSERVVRALVETLAHLHAQGLGHGGLVPPLVRVAEGDGGASVVLLAAELGPLVIRRRDLLSPEHHRYLPPRRGIEAQSAAAGKPDEAELQRADLFALGRIMLELFAGSSVAHHVDQDLRSEQPSPELWTGMVKQNVPRLWQPIVIGLLREDRHLTAAWLRHELDRQQYRAWQRLSLCLAAVALLGLLGTLGVYQLHPARKAAGVLTAQVLSLESVVQRHSERITSQQDRIKQLREELQACQNPPPDPEPTSPCSERVQSHVSPTWARWVQREDGDIAALHVERRSMEKDWVRDTDQPTAAVISEALRSRLRDVSLVDQWQVTLEGISGIEPGWDYAKLTLVVNDRTEWDQRAIRRKNGTWSFDDGQTRAISWHPGDSISLTLEVPGRIWLGSPDYAYVQNTGTGPLALWRLGRVEGMPWQRRCGGGGTVRSKSAQAGAIATGHEAKVMLNIRPVVDPVGGLLETTITEQQTGGGS